MFSPRLIISTKLRHDLLAHNVIQSFRLSRMIKQNSNNQKKKDRKGVTPFCLVCRVIDGAYKQNQMSARFFAIIVYIPD